MAGLKIRRFSWIAASSAAMSAEFSRQRRMFHTPEGGAPRMTMLKSFELNVIGHEFPHPREGENSRQLV
jgi:hypothetical protein